MNGCFFYITRLVYWGINLYIGVGPPLWELYICYGGPDETNTLKYQN